MPYTWETIEQDETITLYHGSDDPDLDWLSSEICLTDDGDIAAEYGEHVYAIEIDLASLKIIEVDEPEQRPIPGYYPDDMHLDTEHDAHIMYYDWDRAPTSEDEHKTWYLTGHAEDCIEEINDSLRKVSRTVMGYWV